MLTDKDLEVLRKRMETRVVRLAEDDLVVKLLDVIQTRDITIRLLNLTVKSLADENAELILDLYGEPDLGEEIRPDNLPDGFQELDLDG